MPSSTASNPAARRPRATNAVSHSSSHSNSSDTSSSDDDAAAAQLPRGAVTPLTAQQLLAHFAAARPCFEPPSDSAPPPEGHDSDAAEALELSGAPWSAHGEEVPSEPAPERSGAASVVRGRVVGGGANVLQLRDTSMRQLLELSKQSGAEHALEGCLLPRAPCGRQQRTGCLRFKCSNVLFHTVPSSFPLWRPALPRASRLKRSSCDICCRGTRSETETGSLSTAVRRYLIRQLVYARHTCKGHGMRAVAFAQKPPATTATLL